MIQRIKLFTCYLVLGVIIDISCKKELSCEGCKGNKPPIANAGRDTTIILPKDSVSLDGSASNDPDGSITSYKWAKIAGPVSSNITSANSAKSLVKNMVMGVYQFEVTVTDNSRLSAKDTMQVIVGAPGNQLPVACAGTDQTITLPANMVTLNGSCSADPDNNITAYSWTNISASAANITTANVVQTQVTNLVQGVYNFELKVTDAGVLFSKDTVQVTVNPQPMGCGDSNRLQINARLIPIGTLSQARLGMAVASAGNKVVFAGGHYISHGTPSSKVDFYDIATQTWTSADLSIGRYMIAAVTNGNKIFFGGGDIGDGTAPVDMVDIYDVSTNLWTTSRLSIRGHSIAAAAVGNKVLFAGGEGEGIWQERMTRVDIYDLTTNTWYIGSLSEGKRGGHVAVSMGSKVYVAGGGGFSISNKVDIYDNVTNTWSRFTMHEAKADLAGIAVGNKIYWAGGIPNSNELSCLAEIKDITTGNSSIQHLFQSAEWWTNNGQNAVVKDNKIIFYSSFGRVTNKFDIYDITTNTWSIGVLPEAIEGASIISANNVIYLAGGMVNGILSDKVYKLDF